MTKRVRRLLSLAFALALLAGLALPACAEGTITPVVPRPVQMERERQSQNQAESEPEIEAQQGSIRVADAETQARAPLPRDREIYVSAGGDDMGEGSWDDPLATLAAAAEAANAAEEGTVYVILLSDLVSTRTARFLGKNVILMSEGVTRLISRGSNFQTAYDGLRQAYNPALIEVGELQSTQGLRTSLSIDNVVLDDGGLHEGGEFLPQTAGGDMQANLARVQDAIVAVYDGSTLTLNPGTELRNFGGMSAVRAVGNALVTAEDFSAVYDTAPIDAPAGLRTILSEGAAVRIASRASVVERSAAPAPDEETPDEEIPVEEIPIEELPEEEFLNEELPEEEIPYEESADEEAAEEEIPVEEFLSVEPEAEALGDAANAAGAEDVPAGLQELMGLINNGTNDFTAGQLQELLADVPAEDLQALVEQLSGNSDAAELVGQVAALIGGDSEAADELIERLNELISGSGGDDPLQTLSELLGGSFTPEQLAELLANVPAGDVQDLLSALTGDDNSGAGELIDQLSGLIGGDGGPADELIDRLNELIGGGGSGDDPLQTLSDLLGGGFTPDQLADLLANVPAGDVQDLLSALTGDDNSGAGELIDRLSGLIGGDGGSGDELIDRLNELINGGSGGNSGIDGDMLKRLSDLLGGSVPLGELGNLLSGFTPEQLDSLANIIGGNGTDADITNLFSNLAGMTGLLEMSGEPKYLIQGEEPYLLRGTLTVKLPDTLIRTLRLASAAVSSGTGEFTVTPDSRLSVLMKDGAPDTVFTSNIFQADSVTLTDGNLVVAFSLKEGWREHLDELNAPIRFQWKSALEEQDFAVGEYLVTRAVLDRLEINVGGRTLPGRLDNVSAELRTRMLPGEGSMLYYDINGGEGGPEPNPVFVNMQTGYALESENTPTHADADGKPVVFIGWTAEKDTAIYARGESAPGTLTTIDVGMSEDRTVYALYGFDENEDGIPDALQQLVQLSFDANGGEGAPGPILAVAVAGVGASIDIPSTEPSLKYYTFLGWSKDPGAAAADYKYNAEKAADRDILITKDTMLYAVWQQNPSYTLYYNANGGTGAPAAQTGISDENDSVELVISSAVPERSGYSFLGWSSRRSGSAEFFAGDKVNITGGNVTLYAVWQKGGSSYSGGGGGGSSSGAPKTGDDAPIALYAALAVISLGAVGAGAWLILRKKK